MKRNRWIRFTIVLSMCVFISTCRFDNGGKENKEQHKMARVSLNLTKSQNRNKNNSQSGIYRSFDTTLTSLIAAIPAAYLGDSIAFDDVETYDVRLADIASQTVSLTLPLNTEIGLVKYDFDAEFNLEELLAGTYHDFSENLIDVRYSNAFTFNEGETSKTVTLYSTGKDADYTILTWQGTQQVGSIGTDSANAMVMDGNGFLYTVGSSNAAWLSQTPDGTVDIQFTQFTNGGSITDVQFKGSTDVDVGTDIAIDSSGDIYICGYTKSGSIAGTTFSGTQAFLMKYNASRSFEWIVAAGPAAELESLTIAIDSDGYLYVASMSGLQKYNNAGNKIDSATYPADSAVTDMAIDSADNIYIAVVNFEKSESHILKYDSLLTLITDKTDETGKLSSGLTTDSDGNVYITGITSLEQYQSNNGGMDILVEKLDSDLNAVWGEQIGTTSDSTDAFGSDIAVDSDGNVYVAGTLNGELSGETQIGHFDLALAKYNASGTKLWHRQFGPIEIDSIDVIFGRGINLVLDREGGIYLSGTAADTIDGATNANAGSKDIFLIKFDADGNRICAGDSSCS